MFPASREGQGRAAATGGGGRHRCRGGDHGHVTGRDLFFLLPYLVLTVQSRWSRAEMLSLPSR